MTCHLSAAIFAGDGGYQPAIGSCEQCGKAKKYEKDRRGRGHRGEKGNGVQAVIHIGVASASNSGVNQNNQSKTLRNYGVQRSFSGQEKKGSAEHAESRRGGNGHSAGNV